MQTLKINGLWTQFVAPLRAREPFRTGGAMHGEPAAPDGSTQTGRLPAEWITSAKLADYVIWSYGTPIAWHRPAGTLSPADPGAWIMPDLFYSVTTSKQADRIRTALSVIDDPAYDQEIRP
jgi:hypothetical protein